MVVMNVTYAIIKVYVTEHHANVISIWRMSTSSDCIIKNLCSEMKGVQEKESIMGMRGR